MLCAPSAVNVDKSVWYPASTCSPRMHRAFVILKWRAPGFNCASWIISGFITLIWIKPKRNSDIRITDGARKKIKHDSYRRGVRGQPKTGPLWKWVLDFFSDSCFKVFWRLKMKPLSWLSSSCLISCKVECRPKLLLNMPILSIPKQGDNFPPPVPSFVRPLHVWVWFRPFGFIKVDQS